MDAKERGNEFHDRASEWRIVNREAVRQELWNKQMQNPALTPTETLRRPKVWDHAGSSTAGGSGSRVDTSAEPFRSASWLKNM